jgi:hypothetical protein
MKNIWIERIEQGLENESLKLLANIYCEILCKGKDSGEYSEWEESTLEKIAAHIEKEADSHMLKVLDGAVLEDKRIAITHKSRFK